MTHKIQAGVRGSFRGYSPLDLQGIGCLSRPLKPRGPTLTQDHVHQQCHLPQQPELATRCKPPLALRPWSPLCPLHVHPLPSPAPRRHLHQTGSRSDPAWPISQFNRQGVGHTCVTTARSPGGTIRCRLIRFSSDVLSGS